ncbi:MAG TPA: hypothetical protein VKY19_13740 [Ktedonosporobacter sp.]|jgi:hypothetical protein|nr:hypothetical protein [Ktedonosporobacter sp.]
MFDPRLVILFGLIFIGLGIFNLVMGRRRILRARAQGESPVWYKQIAILTGIEYLLLSVAFFLSISLSYGWLPSNFNALVIPAYLVILLASGALAAYVVYQGIATSRKARRSREAQTTRETGSVTIEKSPMTAEQQAEQLRKRRERRQKAAAARRRRAGKA